MKERIIELKEIDPLEIYGVNNRVIERLSSYFPKIKVAARGSTIRVKGSEADSDLFQEKLEKLITVRRRQRQITEKDVDNLFDPNWKSESVIVKNRAEDLIVYGTEGKVIRARTVNQKAMVKAYDENDLLFALGPAGTGKTYTAIALAVRALKGREVRKIILTRPAVEAGERLGFLPGDLRDKLDPYLRPLYDALRDMIPTKRLADFIEDGTIEIAPLAYMRGRTLESAFVILDEAQNTTLGQLKMFLTRMGNNSKFMVTGDMTQIDLPRKSDSGLYRGVELLKGIRGLSVIHFDKRDIVRHPLVNQIVTAFEKEDRQESNS